MNLTMGQAVRHLSYYDDRKNMESGVSESICGQINLLQDYIVFDVFVPIAGKDKQICYQFPGNSEVCIVGESYRVVPPLFPSGQCSNKQYYLILDVYNDRYGNNNVVRFYAVWTNLLFYPNFAFDFGFTKILGLENRENTNGFNGGIWIKTIEPNAVNPDIYPLFPNSAMWDWRYRNARLVRKDGTNESSNSSQCGVGLWSINIADSDGNTYYSASGDSAPYVRIIPSTPCKLDSANRTLRFSHLRTLPGSRIAVINYQQGERYGTRIVEYYFIHSTPEQNTQTPVIYEHIIRDYLSATNCHIYPLVQWDCDGKCNDKKCPPETCLKVKNGNEICCYGDGGIVIAIVPSECENADCECT